jgi:type III pantothenate kinase
LQAQLAALIGSTAQLPDIDLRPPKRYLGNSTHEAIRSGVHLSFQGGVKEVLKRLSDELPGDRAPQIFLTGGHAGSIAMNLELPVKLRPLLVFEGLRMIGTRAFVETI